MAIRVQRVPPSAVEYSALVWVQSLVKCAHVPVSTTAHPVRVLVKEAAVSPPSGRPKIRTADCCLPSPVTVTTWRVSIDTISQVSGPTITGWSLMSPAGCPSETTVRTAQKVR